MPPSTQKLQLPLIRGFRATRLSKAFLLDAFVTALITLFAIELRTLFNDEKGKLYGYVNSIYGVKTLSSLQILSVMFLTTFLGAMLVYLIMYALLDYGGGMLTPDGKMAF
jgi:hypothetical protein